MGTRSEAKGEDSGQGRGSTGGTLDRGGIKKGVRRWLPSQLLLFSGKSFIKTDMVVHAFIIPVLERQGQEDLCEIQGTRRDSNEMLSQRSRTKPTIKLSL